MRKHLRLVAFALSCFMAFSLLISCASKKEKYTSTYFDYFDSFATLTVYTDSEQDYAVWNNIFRAQLEKYHKLLDTYNEYDGLNNLYTVNRDAAKEAVKVDTALFDFLKHAVSLNTLTKGYTSVTMGAVTSVWKKAIEDKALPDATALAEAAKHTSVSDLVLDDVLSTVRFEDSALNLDAGALGKGYVSDVIRNVLIAAGCDCFLLNVGGTVTGFGTKPDGNTWQSGIQDPRDDRELDVSVNVSGHTLSTSGSYIRGFELDGVRYHHIINPRTSRPENIYLSVSVACTSGAKADALSTALFSMPFEDGQALMGELDGVEAVWIMADGSIKSTKNLKTD